MIEKEPKRGRGRPSKLPPGDRHGLRCVVVGSELEFVTRALAALGISQLEFCREAVLTRAASVLGEPIPDQSENPPPTKAKKRKE